MWQTETQILRNNSSFQSSRACSNKVINMAACSILLCRQFNTKQFINDQNKEETSAISKLQSLLQESTLPQHLAFIKTNFSSLATAITKLEGRLFR